MFAGFSVGASGLCADLHRFGQNISWRLSAASASPRSPWDTCRRSSARFRRRRIDGRGRGGAAAVVTGQGWGCVDSGRLSVDRHRAAGARPHFVTTPVPPTAPWLSCRKAGRTCRAPRARQRLFNICTTGVLGYTNWCEERGRRRYWTAKFATSCCRNLGVSCVSAPS